MKRTVKLNLTERQYGILCDVILRGGGNGYFTLLRKPLTKKDKQFVNKVLDQLRGTEER